MNLVSNEIWGLMHHTTMSGGHVTWLCLRTGDFTDLRTGPQCPDCPVFLSLLELAPWQKPNITLAIGPPVSGFREIVRQLCISHSALSFSQKTNAFLCHLTKFPEAPGAFRTIPWVCAIWGVHLSFVFAGTIHFMWVFKKRDWFYFVCVCLSLSEFCCYFP